MIAVLKDGRRVTMCRQNTKFRHFPPTYKGGLMSNIDPWEIIGRQEDGLLIVTSMGYNGTNTPRVAFHPSNVICIDKVDEWEYEDLT